MHELNIYFKASFLKLEDLYEARKISWGKAIFYLLFLSVIIALPITTDTWTTTEEILHDARVVGEKIPDFTIVDKKLESKANGFMYQTKYFVFTFDPQGKRTEEEIASVSSDVLGIAFLPNSFVVSLPQSLSVDEEPKLIEMKYDKGSFRDMTGKRLRHAMSTMSQPIWMLVFVYLISFIPAIFQMVWLVVFLGVAGMIHNKLSRLSIRYSEVIRIILFASTAPIILSTILVFFFPTLNSGFIQTVATLILYFRTLTPLKVKKNQNQ
ncbi:Protein of unknown function [Pilibacter termitis]|uniref:Maltodextrin utilization protein YvdJ n=1 Tax=Pilibacter termitis TaxID=263852 RepID=A0A1T4PYP5_9ENTE|nr:DUF1189 domain-containing protein [Pilibacter termitis]SJZ96690.1 Protein of unknown function [Pilibacter termitis]